MPVAQIPSKIGASPFLGVVVFCWAGREFSLRAVASRLELADYFAAEVDLGVRRNI
jgi:hypothetical protein